MSLPASTVYVISMACEDGHFILDINDDWCEKDDPDLQPALLTEEEAQDMLIAAPQKFDPDAEFDHTYYRMHPASNWAMEHGMDMFWYRNTKSGSTNHKEMMKLMKKEQATVQQEAHQFGELMAVMHCDGGHYLEKHGPQQAAHDAIKRWYATIAELDQLRAALTCHEKLMNDLSPIHHMGFIKREPEDGR